MPYYHVQIRGKDGRALAYEHDQTENSIRILTNLYMKGKKFLVHGNLIDPFEVGKFLIYKTDQHRNEIMGVDIWDIGADVTREFIDSPPTKTVEPKPHANNVFIVHGRDHKPMREIKAMLKEFGLNPIVLHEQPSGSRTIIEKLEEYSDVGYAFVILTPDDLGTSHEEFDKYNKNFVEELAKFRNGKQREDETQRRLAENVENFIENRARQNVILEFGYFMGKLNRDKVCCLLKGDVERPSDMHGIVYIPFKESVNEVRNKIVKELKAAGYEIKA